MHPSVTVSDTQDHLGLVHMIWGVLFTSFPTTLSILSLLIVPVCSQILSLPSLTLASSLPYLQPELEQEEERIYFVLLYFHSVVIVYYL